MAVYITGDTHGRYTRFIEFDKILKKGDILIIAGDFGFIFYDNDDEQRILDKISERPYTVLWVDGNHENFNALYKYPMEEYNGGKVHRIRNNIYHLCRGQVFNICGKKFFTMGGGFSLDYMYRIENISWWRDEMPDDEEYKEANKNLELNGNKVDYIVSHTAPECVIKMYSYKDLPQEKKLNKYFQNLYETIDFKQWYHGHLHDDIQILDDIRILRYDVVRIIE